MKSFTFFLTFISFCSLQPGYGEGLVAYEENDAMLEIEKELLSLEDELLQTEEVAVLEDDALSEEGSDLLSDLSVEQVETQAPEETPSPSEPEELPISPSTPSSVDDPKGDFTEKTSPQEVTIEEISATEIPLPVSNDIKIAQSASVPNFTSTTRELSPIQISFGQVFQGSPYIYSSLLGLSLFAITLALYTLLRLQQDNFNPSAVSKEIKNRLLSHNFSGTMDFCQSSPNFLCQMVASGLICRKQGTHAIIENMRSEGKRITVSAWQRLNLLQDIAVVAPMLGLLGTIVGLFYAFYDLNRSVSSINNLLDGLGVSVGTTVAGIIVAILAMILHSAAKFKLVKSLVKIESEATALAHLMEETHR